ncbi:hypothetical protein ACG2LH_08415 [Zhouia sp. PK063]|uniref:hypothetical protein n=1 Tax=Zhouia sp. PK063 TaxID=3373602 RepID=UPI003799DF84
MKSKGRKLDLEMNSDSILNKWLEYYKKKEPNFSLADFNHTMTDSLNIINGNVFGIFDRKFNEIYDEFLIYNSDKSQYLDFDSYSWIIDKNGEQSFSPDQEINLIDINKKTVNRIGFRGPSQWVEDAFWKNESTIVLLENNYEKQPLISEIDLKNGIVRTFKYNDTLDFETDYTKQRFKQIRRENIILGIQKL